MKPLLLILTALCALAAEPTLRVPEGFKVRTASANVRFPMFATLAEDGRLFVTESSGGDLYEELQKQTRNCRISVLQDSDGDGAYEKSSIYFEGLVPSMGLAWRDGKLYVADPPDLITLEDTDNDGRADKRTVLLTSFGHTDNGSLHGLTFGPDGWLYMTTGQPDGYRLKRADGSFLEGKSGALLRCKPDGSNIEVLSRGFENLIEIAFLPSGEMIGTDNWFSLPHEGVRDALVHLVPGGVYPLNVHARTETNFFFTGEILPAIQTYPAVAFSGLMRHSGKNLPVSMRDNLFSAQFNTRKIIRHQIFPSANTFGAQDEDFLWTDDPDFHPSDVLEDRDGSILVLDTGSWYVHHCPTGRIRKTAAKGGIHRVTFIGKDSGEPASLHTGRPRTNEFFARHEFVYNLRNTDRSTLLRMLNDTDPAKRRAALIILDQPPHNALSFEAAFAALKHDDEPLRRAALESFRKHPDWMPRAVAFAKTNLTPAIADLFITEPEIREAIRNAIENPRRNFDERIALLEIAARHPNKDWQPAIEEIFASQNEKLIAAALRVQAPVESALSNLARNASVNDTLRLEAIRQLPSQKRAPHLDFILSRATATNSPATRLAAAPLLTAAQREFFKNDPLIGEKRLAGDEADRITQLEPLLKGGDENRGQQIFLGKAACSACHRVGKTGSLMGPDLTRIGAIRSGHDLIESLAVPSATFAQGYEPLRVELTSGDILTGMRARQLDDSFVLRDAAGAETRLRPDEIKNIERSNVSLMPDGLLAGLEREEIRDLLAYLQKLR